MRISCGALKKGEPPPKSSPSEWLGRREKRAAAVLDRQRSRVQARHNYVCLCVCVRSHEQPRSERERAIIALSARAQKKHIKLLKNHFRTHSSGRRDAGLRGALCVGTGSDASDLAWFALLLWRVQVNDDDDDDDGGGVDGDVVDVCMCVCVCVG